MVESQFWADKSVKSPCVILKFTVTHLKSPFLKVKPVKPPFSKEFSPHSLHLPGLHSKGLAQKVLRAEVVGPTWHQGLLRPRTTMVPPGFPNGKYRNIICKWIFNSYWTYWSILKKNEDLGFYPNMGIECEVLIVMKWLKWIEILEVMICDWHSWIVTCLIVTCCLYLMGMGWLSTISNGKAIYIYIYKVT